MLALSSCVTALHVGGGARPLLRAHPSSLRAQAPTGVEFWAEPSDPNLVIECLDGAVTPHTPMIFWASQMTKKETRQSQIGSEEAPPPHGASTGVTSWYDHMHVHVHVACCMCMCMYTCMYMCMCM